MNADLILVLGMLTNLRLLASSRVGAAIRTVAAQGIGVGMLPWLLHGGESGWRAIVLALGSMVLKGIVFPWLLFRALREVAIEREMNPYVGYVASLCVGVGALAGSFAFADRLPGLPPTTSALLVPAALFSIWVGLFLLIARRLAIHQVLGFIVLENGVFVFGAGIMQETALLVEVGVLLDVWVAVFVMGILLFHIHREFDHIDTDQLRTLKDV
jgi:hydrogenase-4 component E